ncbi:ExbD/TolR family protein [Chryseobacterium oryctis]|uniref:Biopolymer transporter ExbD n=1 Tax=Chryseobacterium oryctis TaxID=2952618 RepID=A0ABT3HKH3_9FLAO|nr:biopolymer transporter ExbD [Chryseobacterium oryctis]MCW3160287.1 biopolymer transporter ExbD [Chryseobacterium oryctis]
MAEIIALEKNQQGGSKQKKQNVKVDMTPMVDLNFLLLMFFMFTSTFSKPNVMDLGLPAKDPSPIPQRYDIHPKNQVTFILGKDNRVFYHQNSKEDLNKNNLKETDFSGIKISKIISDAYNNAPIKKNFTIIIEPTEDANYKNFVDVLDNIAISKKERYGVTDIKPWEKKVYEELIQ